MKKTFFTIVFVASTFATSFGQYNVIDNGLVLDKYPVPVGHRGFGFYGQDNFLVSNERGTLFFINKQFSVSEKLKIKGASFYTSTESTGFSHSINFNIDEKIIVYSFQVNENNFLELIKKTSTGNGTNLDFKYEKINLGRVENGSWGSGVSAKSQNEKHKVLIINVISAGKYTESFVVVFDDEGEILWKEKVQFNFKQENFGLYDCAVSNDGRVVYVAGVSSEDDNQKNAILEIKRIEENNFSNEEVIKKLDKKTVKNAKINVLSNGNVFLGANYKEGKDAGFFYLTFSKEEPSDYKMGIVPYKNAKLADTRFKDFCPSDNIPLLKGIYETTDGIVSMITEEVDNFNFNNTRNVVINSFNLQGEYQKTSILFRKSSESYGTPVISVSVIDAKDKLLIVYNDNNKNLSTNSPDNAAFLAGGFKINGIVTLCEVVGGGIGNKHKIMDGKTNKFMFSTVIYAKDKVAVLKIMSYNTIPLKFGICKLTWE